MTKVPKTKSKSKREERGERERERDTHTHTHKHPKKATLHISNKKHTIKVAFFFVVFRFIIEYSK
jgi:hypothetical protein